MKTILTLLLLLPVLTFAAEQSAITDAYVIETQRQVEELQWKKDNNQATQKDLFVLLHLQKRLAELSNKGATMLGFSATIANRLTQPIEIQSTSINKQVYFFTDVVNMPGSKLRHVWMSKGRQVYTEEFDIPGDNTRVWSARSIHFPDDLIVKVYLNNQFVGEKTLDVQ
jgi:hypothetical protein